MGVFRHHERATVGATSELGAQNEHAGQLAQMSHVTVDGNGRIYMTFLNGIDTIVTMDDMDGGNLQLFTGTPVGEKLLGPCGIAVR